MNASLGAHDPAKSFTSRRISDASVAHASASAGHSNCFWRREDAMKAFMPRYAPVSVFVRVIGNFCFPLEPIFLRFQIILEKGLKYLPNRSAAAFALCFNLRFERHPMRFIRFMLGGEMWRRHHHQRRTRRDSVLNPSTPSPLHGPRL